MSFRVEKLKSGKVCKGMDGREVHFGMNVRHGH